MNENEIVTAKPQAVVSLGSMPFADPLVMIQMASTIATELAKIVEGQKLFSMISKKKHVRIEGWNTLGAMLGVLPKERQVSRNEDGSYEAYVDLIRASDGAVIGGASALVGMDEKDKQGRLTWAKRPEYARRSMAVTRATGKAFRLGFSWIMALAGYEPTPAEEMIEGEYREVKRKAKKPPPKPKAESGNGQNGQRPYTPAQVKERLTAIANDGGKAGASDKQVGLIASKLEECFAGDKDATKKRHTVTNWLFGFDSTKQMTQGHVDAVIKWILKDGKKDDTGDYPLHPSAPAEAAAIVREALKEAGQQEMPLEAE